MPNPCGLTDEQFALYEEDDNLKVVFPAIMQNNPQHINMEWTFGVWWDLMKKDHPEVIQRAKDLLAAKGGMPSLTISVPIKPLMEENDESLEALEELQDHLIQAADAIAKYLASHEKD